MIEEFSWPVFVVAFVVSIWAWVWWFKRRERLEATRERRYLKRKISEGGPRLGLHRIDLDYLEQRAAREGWGWEDKT